MRALQILAHLGGVAESSTLRAFGVSRTQVAHALAAGEVVRIRRGAYALPHADPVRVAEFAVNGTATCITAAERWGLPILEHDRRTHLRVQSGRPTAGAHQAPHCGILRHPVPDRVAPPTALEVIDDAGLCLGRDAQLALIDAALNKGLIVASDLTALTRGSTRRRHWLARHADGRAQSPLETLARAALIGARIPFELQVQIPTVGRVDLLAAGRIIIETDGFSYHADSGAFANDRRRDRAASSLGYVTLRFTAAEVRDRELVISAVRAAIAAPMRPRMM